MNEQIKTPVITEEIQALINDLEMSIPQFQAGNPTALTKELLDKNREESTALIKKHYDTLIAIEEDAKLLKVVTTKIANDLMEKLKIPNPDEWREGFVEIAESLITVPFICFRAMQDAKKLDEIQATLDADLAEMRDTLRHTGEILLAAKASSWNPDNPTGKA